MRFHFHESKKLAALLSLSLLTLVPATAASIDKITVFASGTAVSATGPDSITLAPTGVWVAYTNGADSTGKSGSSTVVQYSYAGAVVQQMSIPGSVDGLKYDAERGLMWVLVNQDGNSSFITINGANTMTPLAVSAPSATRGFDDVVFINGGIYMSYTNPTTGTDPTIVYLTGINPVTVATILTQGATGLNLATGQTGQPTAQNDPDSLKTTPTGGLMLGSGDDGQLIFVENFISGNPEVSFLSLIDPNTGSSPKGLDDALFIPTPKGSLYVTDTGNNRVLKVDVSDMQPNSLYASVGSLNFVGNVDLQSGVVTPFITNVMAPHGLAFAADFKSLFGK